ncbi:GlxA family transcriptional regulator [Hwanghaeella grinnelliae]|uniref:GlxA family transcriptional regulator n=1 Tax=Hwanghaeella grinnelliae TaxID=2500179 RepID=A0A437QHS9_9PROT|nr:GlxA family transcriptional regulator [Hwanghaeella grinnelliae]RVU33870.1 GlxA family transcriptional regulator [Hwanghaeella grinnelliae]
MTLFDALPEKLPQRFGFVLVEHFPLMGFASSLEPLRAVNLQTEKKVFDWVLLSEDGQPVVSSSGLTVVPDAAVGGDDFDAVVVVAGLHAESAHCPNTINWLRRIVRRGVTVIGVSAASYIFAKAGILDGRQATIHWEHADGFREDFPHLDISSELFEIDGPVVTCAGGTAAMDMMLHLIEQQLGHNVATRVTDWFLVKQIRQPHEDQRMDLRARIGVSHPKLLAAIGLMEENLEAPLNRNEIAAAVRLSTRQLERLFQKYLRSTPRKYYFSLRMHKAQLLLRQTTLPILEVALASGFVSASHFAKSYREFFGRNPRADRGHGK